jgi:hypothetical protein
VDCCSEQVRGGVGGGVLGAVVPEGVGSEVLA